MDKLITYIENRKKNYGGITGHQALSSNYYTFGKNVVVRISDHIKYGESGVKTFDYCFIIQPNDTYIFTSSPKLDNSQMCRMYLKIVSLKDAKEFVRRLHDFILSLNEMMDIYKPEEWNRGEGEPCEKPIWEDFEAIYLNIDDDNKKLQVLNIIETIYSGNVSKGNYDKKLPKIKEWYNKLSMVQYETLLKKLNKK